MPFDYAACGSDLASPSCDGLECAQDPEARATLESLLEVVADRGYTDVFTPVWARSGNTDQVIIDYQLQVEWMRVAGRIDVDLPEAHAELEDHVDEWTVPEALADQDEVVAAVEGCDPILEIDPCDDFWPEFLVHPTHTEELSGCEIEVTHATVDPRTAEVTQCNSEETYDC